MRSSGSSSALESNARAGSISTLFTSRIIKAGALLEDTWTLLLAWNVGISPKDNLARALSENLLGKTSRSRVEDELAIFRQRYFANMLEANALALIAQGGWARTALNRVLYFLSARSDKLLHDMVTTLLVPMFRSNRTSIGPDDLETRIRKWVDEGKTTSCWSDETITRVAQGLLAALRDFELLSGRASKRITPPFVPVESIAFIAFLLTDSGVAANELTKHPDWGLFFLDEQAVEHLLLEAHQTHLLTYHAAGRIVRIDFPATSLEDYARALT